VDRLTQHSISGVVSWRPLLATRTRFGLPKSLVEAIPGYDPIHEPYPSEHSRLTSVQIPTLCPFVGTALGAWVYDLLVFTGTSPVNTPYMGLKKFVSPATDLTNRRQRYKQRRDPDHAMP